jgi:biotin transport system permease protein
VLLGLYVPGNSPLHRRRAGTKLAVLAVLLGAMGVFRTAEVVAGGFVALTALTLLSGVGPRTMLAQLRPLLWFAVFIGAFQIWLSGPRQAALAVGFLLTSVGLAALVTLTTRTQELLDCMVSGLRPLRRLGVDPERAALTMSLTIRSIPVLLELSQDVQQARRARGAERSLRAFAVPLLIRTVRHADRVGEALAARGVDDP